MLFFFVELVMVAIIQRYFLRVGSYYLRSAFISTLFSFLGKTMRVMSCVFSVLLLASKKPLLVCS
jgi:hypothetical protein